MLAVTREVALGHGELRGLCVRSLPDLFCRSSVSCFPIINFRACAGHRPTSHVSQWQEFQFHRGFATTSAETLIHYHNESSRTRISCSRYRARACGASPKLSTPAQRRTIGNKGLTLTYELRRASGKSAGGWCSHAYRHESQGRSRRLCGAARIRIHRPWETKRGSLNDHNSINKLIGGATLFFDHDRFDTLHSGVDHIDTWVRILGRCRFELRAVPVLDRCGRCELASTTDSLTD